MIRHPQRPRRPLLLTVVLLAFAAGATIGFVVPALASSGAPSRHVPPRLAARATDAIHSRNANARSAENTSGPWWFISKTTAVDTGETTVASLSLPAGTYQLTATGSIWVTGGKGLQTAGCHLVVGSDDYADAYLALDSATITQQSYALVNVLTFKAQTTAVVECLLAKPANDTVSTQVNFVAVTA